MLYVVYLWNHEEQHSFAEVANDGDDGKGHPGEVTEGVAHEHGRRVPAQRGGKQPITGKNTEAGRLRRRTDGGGGE